MILRLEEAEPTAPVGEVLDVARRSLDEAVGLVHELRDERESDPDEDDQHEQVREPDRSRPPNVHPSLQQRHERVEREREEERDQDPRDHVPADPDDLKRDRDGDHDRCDRRIVVARKSTIRSRTAQRMAAEPDDAVCPMRRRGAPALPSLEQRRKNKPNTDCTNALDPNRNRGGRLRRLLEPDRHRPVGKTATFAAAGLFSGRPPRDPH